MLFAYTFSLQYILPFRSTCTLPNTSKNELVSVVPIPTFFNSTWFSCIFKTSVSILSVYILDVINSEFILDCYTLNVFSTSTNDIFALFCIVNSVGNIVVPIPTLLNINILDGFDMVEFHNKLELKIYLPDKTI